MANERYEQGLRLRRATVGNEYVDRAIARDDSFNRPLQELITEYVWGYLWQREGLSKRERCLINLAMLTAMNMPNEIKLYVRASQENDLSRDDIREVFLQTAIYCGLPKAVESFNLANEVFAEQDAT